MRYFITMPKGTTAEQLTQIKNEISSWYIAEQAVVEGLSIKWEQAEGDVPGVKSIRAFVKGLMLGFSIGQQQKLISYGIERDVE